MKADALSRSAYRDMLRVARTVASSEADARDLVQDAVLAALERGMEDWSSPGHRAWLHGVLRKRAAFVIRTAERRRRRERNASMNCDVSLDWHGTIGRDASRQRSGSSDVAFSKSWFWRPPFLSALPPSLRVVAALARADLSAREIQWLLDLSPTALRARLSALKRRVCSEAATPVQELLTQPAAWGPGRSAALNILKVLPNRTMAAHDPDGHVLFFRTHAHKRGADGN